MATLSFYLIKKERNMEIITLLSFLTIGYTQVGISQIFECDRYYISNLRDSTINSDPVIIFNMFTDTNTTSSAGYTSLSFINQNGGTLNPRPNYSFTPPVANTPYDTMEYVLYLDNGLTSFPVNFNGILLMEVPYCEIPYNHTVLSIGIESTKDIDIQIFPNPTSEQILISNKSNFEITSIELYNSTGKLLFIKSTRAFS